jgi:Co/Zn/Cd efflux system component
MEPHPFRNWPVTPVSHTNGLTMRTYVLTTGIIFALLVAAHVWRIAAESTALAADPFYMLITIAAGALSIWALVLLRRAPASRPV